MSEPKVDPTPCGVCGAVVGEGLMTLHMDWHRQIAERADRYVYPPRYGGYGAQNTRPETP